MYIDATLSNASASNLDRLVAALSCLAVATGRSLLEVLQFPLNSQGDEKRFIWRLDLKTGNLVQRAPRRAGHWQRPVGVLNLRPALDRLEWVVPTAAVDALRQALRQCPDATEVGQLWANESSGSCVTAFIRWVKAHAPTARLSGGALAMDVGVRAFLSSGDPLLARLMGARGFAGVPAAAAYAAYTAATVDEHSLWAPVVH